MTERYVVGGIAFVVDDALPGLATRGFADTELRVRFSTPPTGPEGDRSRVRSIKGPSGLDGAIDPIGAQCWLPALYREPEKRAWQLRQMAPVFGAVIERLVLHAGAVGIDGAVVGFIGESGVGKSTLGKFLAGRGHVLVSDDLLPVRLDPQPSSPIGGQLRRLAALCFLTRSSIASVEAVRLSRAAALQSLLTHGFGEHGDESGWAFQFDAYHRLAEAVPAFDLMVPDDRSALPQVESAMVSLGSDRTSRPPADGGS